MHRRYRRSTSPVQVPDCPRRGQHRPHHCAPRCLGARSRAASASPNAVHKRLGCHTTAKLGITALSSKEATSLPRLRNRQTRLERPQPPRAWARSAGPMHSGTVSNGGVLRFAAKMAAEQAELEEIGLPRRTAGALRSADAGPQVGSAYPAPLREESPPPMAASETPIHHRSSSRAPGPSPVSHGQDLRERVSWLSRARCVR